LQCGNFAHLATVEASAAAGSQKIRLCLSGFGSLTCDPMHPGLAITPANQWKGVFALRGYFPGVYKDVHPPALAKTVP
jgi:hypothetical protein